MNLGPVMLHWVPFVLVSLMAACGPGVQEGPVPVGDKIVPTDTDDKGSDSDTSDTGTASEADTVDTNTEGTVAPETDSIEADAGLDSDGKEDWCPAEVIADEAALTAEQILDGGEMVAMDADCLLVARAETEGYTAAVAFISAQLDDKVLSISESVVPSKPRAIACRHDEATGSDIAYVVASTDSRGALYELEGGDGSWQLAYEGARLSGVQQMYRTAQPKVDDLCVFGDGAVCFPRGVWTAPRVEIPSGGNVDIADMILVSCAEGGCPAAVGRAGYVAVKQSGEWKPITVNTEADLRDIAVNDSYISVVGGGVFMYGDSAGLQAYRILDGRDIVSHVWQDPRTFKGAASDGVVFVGEVRKNEVYVCPNWVALEPPLLDSGIFTCGGDDFLVLGPDAVVGEYNCTIVTI